MELAIGLRLSAEVVEVTPNFDQIPNSTKKCHLTIFRTDDGQDYRGQLCSDQASVPYKSGDTIQIAIRKLTRGTYTFELERVIPANPQGPIKPKQSDEEIPLLPPVWNITGTPGHLALLAAVQHNQNRIGIKAEDVLADAELFAEFIRTNTF